MLEHAKTFSRPERETVILYSDADDTASIFTRNVALANKLAKMAEEHDEVKVTLDDGYSVEFELPKRLVSIRAPRTLSDEQRERAIAQLAAARIAAS